MIPATSERPNPVLSIALDLTASLAADDRHRRLITSVRDVIPCDAAAVLVLDDGILRPVAAHGLVPEAMSRTYAVAAHPRLAAICESEGAVIFPPASDLPDPFDGLLAADPSGLGRVHACLGCPLRVEGRLVGVLTADALEPGRFDDLDPHTLSVVAALAGAALRTGRLIEALERSASRLGLVATELLRDAGERRGGDLLGATAEIERLRREIGLVAGTDLAVLITGETGTGKELVARAVHGASARSREPLIYVNCAALPESIAESELFGHVRGAFTGADAARPGKFEIADGGSLFLDEVGELPLSVQPKLLRALQQGEIQRVGSDKAHRVDVRVMAATNRDLAKEVEAGRFRADLYHRLAVYPLHVPALRDRTADIPLLAGHFCDQMRRRLGLGPVRLSAAARNLLRAASWPGNVRELENVIARAVVRASAGVPRGEPVILGESALGLGPGDAAPAPPAGAASPPSPAPPIQPGATLRESVDDFQRELIRRAIADHGGNRAAAARALGLHRSNLHTLCTRLGLGH